MSEHSDHAGEIEELTNRYQNLSNAQVRAQTNLENAQQNLAKLATEAEQQFGTSDVNELKRQLAEIEAENQKRKSDYQKHLDSIETKLAEVEEGAAQTADDDD